MMKQGELLRIGELAKEAGVSLTTVKFYAKEGLIRPARKTGRNMAYYDRALTLAMKIGDHEPATQARLGRVKVMGIMGFFHEAITELDTLESKGIPDELKEEWLDCGRQLYSYMEGYTMQGNSRNMNQYIETYVARQRYYRTEQLKLLPKDSPRHKLFLAEQYYIDGNNKQAKKLLHEILDNGAPDNNIYARAAANMAIIREEEDNDDDAARYFAMSAIADIRTAVKETTSLQKLALHLYESGDIDHAYAYISASLADAVFCNARLRTSEISSITPLIDNAYKVQLRKKHKLLMFATLISTLLAIAFVGACFFLLKRRFISLRQTGRAARRAGGRTPPAPCC